MRAMDDMIMRKVVIERQVFVRPVDVAEFIYKKIRQCSEEGKSLDEVISMLEKIIVDMKEEKFAELAAKWGVDP